MINPKLCLLAENVIRDFGSNSMSAINIIETVTAQGFPVFFHKLSLLVMWEKEPTDPFIFESVLTIKLNDETLLSQQIKIDFENKNRNRGIVKLDGLLIKNPGTLSATMTVGKIEAKTTVLIVSAENRAVLQP